MDIFIFDLILLVVIIALIITLFIRFEWRGDIGIALCMFLCIGCFIIPNAIFNKNAVYSNERCSYELIQNDFIQPQSGRYGGVLVSYIDENGKLKKYNVDRSNVVYYDGIPKIEFVKAKWGFLSDIHTIIYLNEE